MELGIDDLSSFVGITEKDDVANYDNTDASHHSKENDATAHHVQEIKFILAPE